MRSTMARLRTSVAACRRHQWAASLAESEGVGDGLRRRVLRCGEHLRAGVKVVEHPPRDGDVQLARGVVGGPRVDRIAGLAIEGMSPIDEACGHQRLELF